MLKAPFLKYWDYVRSSFWFVPSLMATGAIALALAMVALDQHVTGSWLQEFGLIYAGGADGASAVLQTIAGSMITIAGVVFSLTLVALSLASQQFGPRLVYNFMRDRSNQLVLGTFIATFLYCLLVLRTIRYAEDDTFVPHLSVTLGVLFALASLWVLIYFIHHVSVSIQADQIVARVGADLNRGVEKIFPAQMGREPAEPSHDAAVRLPKNFDREARSVPAGGDGYLQLIDVEGLMNLATECDAVLRLEHRPGHYIVCGGTLARVWPSERVDEEFIKRLNSVFVMGHQRTPTQDLEYAILQLVEIAVRALSPGVNDPFTAISCIDRLGSGLCRVARSELPSASRDDEQGRLRVVVPPITFEGVIGAAFNQIRQHARSSAAVSIRLLETIKSIAEATTRPDDRAVLQRHADMIARGARESIAEPEDRRVLEERYSAVTVAQQRPEQRAHSGARVAAPLPAAGRDERGSEGGIGTSPARDR